MAMGIVSIDKIQDDLNKIGQLIDKFGRNGQVAEIERDIVLSKLRSVYEAVQFLTIDRIDLPELTGNLTIESRCAEVKTEPVKAEVPPKMSEPVTRLIAEQKEQKTIVEESKPFVLVTEKERQSSPEEKHPAPKKIVVAAKTEILADKFQSTAFLNDTFAQFRSENDLSKKLQNQPLDNIFSAIAINDKFLFIKELFNNDGAQYQETIEKLNNFVSFNEAVRYLDEHFSWDFNEPLVGNLLELVHRRYLAK